MENARADKAFIGVVKLISKFRNENPEYTDSDMVYAILQAGVMIDEGPSFWEFMKEALNECIDAEAEAYIEARV